MVLTSEEEEEQVRCVCGQDLKSNYIQCEKCLCWQHSECVNLKKIPKTYFCEECEPSGHPYYELFKKKTHEPKSKRSTLNSRLAEEDLDFLKIIEESKLTAYAHPPGEEKMDTGLEPDQGLVILMIDEGLPSDQVENTLPNSSDEENNRDQEFSQARQSKSPRKSPLAKKKKRQPKLVALKPLKFAEMHKRAKTLSDIFIDEPENDLIWESSDMGFIPTGSIELVAGQVHSALLRFQQKWDQY